MSWRRRFALQLARRDQRRQASVRDLADEGMLLVSAALRLSAKNLIILRTLRDGADHDEQVLLDALRAEINDLIEEKRRELARLQQERTRAGRRLGWATKHDDYRKKDVPTLRLREAVARRLLVLLRARHQDEAYLRGILAESRDSALDEMLQNRLLQFVPMKLDRRYHRDRDLRLDLVRHDLTLLLDSIA
ncbi:hypothetical protein [Herbiconiux sp. L3-i23]|uniref:hypothetical protein n=1 Tax=Herbiconiux sp. L3-i23 TaxID=2905871 RepID=UPI0020516A85|nr:hypothetical protein [Herbiconiux sp. L3-i23]BDI23409.1 hypothetical protein L3i23_21850 [Herbiconiux sp. L3-i23]